MTKDEIKARMDAMSIEQQAKIVLKALKKVGQKERAKMVRGAVLATRQAKDQEKQLDEIVRQTGIRDFGPRSGREFILSWYVRERGQ